MSVNVNVRKSVLEDKQGNWGLRTGDMVVISINFAGGIFISFMRDPSGKPATTIGMPSSSDCIKWREIGHNRPEWENPIQSAWSLNFPQLTADTNESQHPADVLINIMTAASGLTWEMVGFGQAHGDGGEYRAYQILELEE